MQQAARHDDLATEIAALARHDAFQLVLGLDFLCVFNRDQLLAEPELHERVHRLAIGPLGQLLAGDAIGESGNVDDALVGVEEVRLPARRSLRFDDERRQRAMRRRQARRQARRPGADDDDVPVAKVLEIETGLKRLDVEVRHTVTVPNLELRSEKLELRTWKLRWRHRAKRTHRAGEDSDQLIRLVLQLRRDCGRPNLAGQDNAQP